MEERTFSYLTGRFRDYYRTATIVSPPDTDEREWGYIPWRADGSTVMLRHLSLLEIGDPQEFLHSEVPRHVYTSASRYADPGAGSMDEKRWQDSDLIFDIDVDEGHLPEHIDAESLSYTDELALAKTHLQRLLSVLESDFGFEDLDVVFSGGRGYHVHVRDEQVKALSSKHRTEIVSYVQGVNLDLDSLVRDHATTIGSPLGGDTVAFRPDGGWSSRVHDRLVEVAERYHRMARTHSEQKAAAELAATYDGIGPENSTQIITGIQDQMNALRAGKVNPSPGLKRLANALTDVVHQETYADIDEPVTTDVNRLIRLPGSLHGRTGMRVTPVPRENVESFDPLTDAVPETFRSQEIAIELHEPATVKMCGVDYDLDPGRHELPEYVGIYLMANGLAEKLTE
jgi:DNA primase small subunit